METAGRAHQQEAAHLSADLAEARQSLADREAECAALRAAAKAQTDSAGREVDELCAEVAKLKVPPSALP